MTDLIDTTEMYLRTIFELTEEGILPMRARIAERLGQSGPTVSQTVGRMQRDGLVEIDQGDRHLVLTEVGLATATRVMRKHRLAECLLVEVIGLPWPDAHDEACRWEHVMSEQVERRLMVLLDAPAVSPFGNPIPGLAEVAQDPPTAPDLPAGAHRLSAAGMAGGPARVRVVRLAEPLQVDRAVLADLHRVGAVPDGEVTVHASGGGLRIAGRGGESVELTSVQAGHLIVCDA